MNDKNWLRKFFIYAEDLLIEDSLGVFISGEQTIYSQFSVNPPSTNLSFSNEDLECGNYERINYDNSFNIKTTCEIKPALSSKVIVPNFIFGKTFGKIYSVYDATILGEADHTCLKYSKNSWGATVCTSREWSNFKLCPEMSNSKYGPEMTKNFSSMNYCNTTTNLSSNGTQYVVDIATTTISYPLSVQPFTQCTEANTPAKPTISGILSGVVGVSYPFSFNPNNATTTYQIDWGAGAGWESVSNPVSKTWTATGTKSIKAKATNTSSLCSSVESDIKTVTINDNATGNLSALTLGTTTPNACGAIKLTWNNNGATSYEIFRDNQSIETVVEGITSYEDKNASVGTTYNYRIYSTKTGYTATTSNTVNATPAVCPACNQTTTNTYTATAPTANFCLLGNNSAVTGSTAPFSWTCSLLGAPVTPVYCSTPATPNPPGTPTGCTLDNVTVASGTTKTFFSSRISATCPHLESYCDGGILVNNNDRDEYFASTTFKFKKCVTPDVSEF